MRAEGAPGKFWGFSDPAKSRYLGSDLLTRGGVSTRGGFSTGIRTDVAASSKTGTGIPAQIAVSLIVVSSRALTRFVELIRRERTK